MDSKQIAEALAGESVEPPNPGTEGLLSLFPIIKREAAYGVYEDEYKPIDEGYVYSRGRVLSAEDTIPREHQGNTRPSHTTNNATSHRTQIRLSKEPHSQKASRSQSPLVPVPLPAMNFAPVHQSTGSPSAQRLDREDPRLIHDSSRFTGQDHEPIMHPVEQEGDNRSSVTSSRHSSLSTTASDESARSAGNTASIQDLGLLERLNSTTKTQ